MMTAGKRDRAPPPIRREAACRLNAQHLAPIFLDIPHRLAKRLLALVSQYGKPTPEGLTIDIKLSQENLGQMLGVSRESVNKGIRALESQGVIVQEHGFISIRDIASLEGLVRLRQEP